LPAVTGSNVHEGVPSAQAVEEFFGHGPSAIGSLWTPPLASGAGAGFASPVSDGGVASSGDLKSWEAMATALAWFAANDGREPPTFSNRQLALPHRGR
jgi:hypothetical protein